MDHISDITPQDRDVIEKLDQVSEDESLKNNIFDILERYLNDRSWPSNFQELEGALERLMPGLSQILRICLININLFVEQISQKRSAFLKGLEYYSYRYKVGAYKTVLSGDGFHWDRINVQGFEKNNTPWYGISILRNDGEQIYFEGHEDSIIRMIDLIKGTMERKEETESEGE